MDAMGEERGQHLPLQPPNGCSCGVGEGGREALKTPKEHPPKNTELWQPHTLPHLKQHPDPPEWDQVQPPVLDATPLSTTHQNELDAPL